MKILPLGRTRSRIITGIVAEQEITRRQESGPASFTGRAEADSVLAAFL